MEFQLTLPIPAGEGIYCWDAASIATLSEVDFHKLRLVLEEFGKRSAQAQGLRAPITDIWRLRGTDQRAYLHLRQAPGGGPAGSGRLVLLGGLKVGSKRLFIRREDGVIHEMDPCCVLDFYVHESCQRLGLGRGLFERFLSAEGRAPHQLAYDRPSPKLLAFLRKHYGLSSYTPQNNNFVVFDQYFDQQQQEQQQQQQQQRHGGATPRQSSYQQQQQQQQQEQQAASSSRPPPLWQQPQQAPSAQGFPAGPLSSRRRTGTSLAGNPPLLQQQQNVLGPGVSGGGSILGGSTSSSSAPSWQQQQQQQQQQQLCGRARRGSSGSGGGQAAHVRDSLDSLLDGMPSTQQQEAMEAQPAAAASTSTSSYSRQQQQQHSRAPNPWAWEQPQQQQGTAGGRQWSAGVRPPYAVQDWVPAPIRTTTPSLAPLTARRGAAEPGTMVWAGYTLTLPPPAPGAAGDQGSSSSMVSKKAYVLPTEAMAGALPAAARPASGAAGLYRATLGGSEGGGFKAADANVTAWRTSVDAGTQQQDQHHLTWALNTASRSGSGCGQASASRQVAYAQQRGHGAASCMRFYC